MLELLFQGFIEWIYGLVLECWEYFASVLFELMSLDFAYLREHIPIIDTIRQIMLGVGWALLIGNLVFQATRGMAAGLGFDAEDPKLLFTRTFAFSFLLVASPQICELGLNMTSTVIELLQMPNAVDITFADEASFAGMAGSWLLVVICGIIVMFQTFRLIMEMAERYFILAVLTITSPLAFGMGGSRNTSDIFTGWCRMFGSMCLLMATNVMFVKMLLSVLSYYPSGLDVLPWMVLVITIVKVAKKADSILSRIGLNPAMTGDPLGRGFPGAMTMMVVRSLVSNAAHTIGKNGGQPRSGSGNPKPNAPTGPRSGGGNTSNVNAPSYANGYHHSAAAQQNSAGAVSTQEPVSTQAATMQADTVQSAAEKAAGAFPQAAPAGIGKQPNATRKTAVPPGTRRAPGHVAAPKNHAEAMSGKAAPGAPYHQAGIAQPIMGGAASQNTQMGQTVQSQSESHPRSSASVQNRSGAVSFGAAGKQAAPTPPRSSVQPTGTAGNSYHTNNVQGQTVQSESAQQRSTLVQPISAPSGDTAGTGVQSPQSEKPQNAPAPSVTGTQRTSIGGRYIQPVQQTTRVSASGNTQITQQNHVSAQQTSGSAPRPGTAHADGRFTNRERPAPAAPVSPAAPASNREAGTPARSTARPEPAHPTEQRTSQRPIPAQSGSAEKTAAQITSHSAPVPSTSDRQSRKPTAPLPTGSVTAPASVSQESRGSQRSTPAESSAKRPASQKRKSELKPEQKKNEQTLYHRPGAAGIAPTAVEITTDAAAAQKPSAEKTAKKPFVPLTGRTPESIPSHLDLHETSQKTTKRPQQEVTPGE